MPEIRRALRSKHMQYQTERKAGQSLELNASQSPTTNPTEELAKVYGI